MMSEEFNNYSGDDKKNGGLYSFLPSGWETGGKPTQEEIEAKKQKAILDNNEEDDSEEEEEEEEGKEVDETTQNISFDDAPDRRADSVTNEDISKEESGWIIPTKEEKEEEEEEEEKVQHSPEKIHKQMTKEEVVNLEEEEEENEEVDNKLKPSYGELVDRANNFGITVGEYEKHGEGLKAHVSYKINVKTSLVQYNQPEFITERRFNDFSWLHDKLKESFKGFIIPPLPAKTVTQNRFDTVFIERRRRDLEKFLKEITEHPVLSTSEILQTFLETPTEAFEAEKQKKPQSGYTKKMFSWMSTTVTQQLSPAVEIDPWFESKLAYLTGLEAQLNNILKISVGLLEKDKERTLLHYDIGVASAEVAKSEEEIDKTLSRHWSKFSDVHEQIRLVEQELSNDHEIRFDEPVANYLHLIVSAKETLNNRLVALAEFQNVEKRVNNLKEKMEKPGYKPNKNNDTTLEQLQKRQEETKEEYEMISDSIRKEMVRFELTKGKELTKAILEFAKSNMDVTLQIADQWKKLINQIQSD